MTLATWSGRALLRAVLLLPVAGTAAGQTIDSPYRFLEERQAVSPFAGYIAASKGALGLGPESAPAFGARYGIRISGPFVLEADAGYFSSTRTVLDTVPADTTVRPVGEADLSLVLVRGALRFNVTGPRTFHNIQPFVVFGGGAAIDVSGDAPAEEDLPADVRYDFGTSFAGEVGAGLEWFLSPALAIRLDARNLLWRLDTPLPFLAGERGRNLPDQQWAQNFHFAASISVHF